MCVLELHENNIMGVLCIAWEYYYRCFVNCMKILLWVFCELHENTIMDVLWMCFCLEMFKLWYITLIAAVLSSQAYGGITCGRFDRKLFVIRICDSGRVLSIKNDSRGTYKLQMQCNGNNGNFQHARIKWLNCVETNIRGTKMALARRILDRLPSSRAFNRASDMRLILALWG